MSDQYPLALNTDLAGDETSPPLHPDIVAAERRSPHGKIVEVINPSPGLWGGEPIDGLVTLVYECSDEHPPYKPHTHHALYGPRIVSFPDSCRHCGKIKMWCEGKDHEYEAIGHEVIDREHMELYAD